MQKRRVITNKQHPTATPSQKPELPTSEPPYEVIEFPSQQQYTNALPLRNVQKAGSEKMVQRKCDLCGCSNAQFFCDICVQQTFCASCDQMYHRHPKRQRHIRKRIQQPVEKGMEPPLPPKNEFNQAPIPPPRRNKRTTRTGTPNTLSQGTLKKNGSLMGSLKRIMGGIQSNTPQSTLNRNIAKSPNSMPHSSSATDSDRQSGNSRFGYLDWNTDTRHARSGSFSAFNGPFPSLVQAQSMAQLNCPSCHHQGRSSWDWNRSQMNLNALPPWTGLAAGNPWHGSIIIPPPYPMMANDEFARRDSFHSQRSGRYRKPPAKFRPADDDDDSDFSGSDDRQFSRKTTKSPHLPRTASPALSRRSRRTVASESEDDSASRRSDHQRYKRRTLPAASADCSPAASRRGYRNAERNPARVKKYVEEDDAVSMKSVGSRRSVKSCRSYLLKSRHHSSSDSDDELTSDKDAGEMKMAEVGVEGGSSLQRGSPSKERSARRSSPSTGRSLEDWQCEHCTYLNSSKCKVCDVCCKSRVPTTKSTSTTSPPKEDNVGLESSMKDMRISTKSDQKKKGNERQEENPIKSISTGTSPPPQTTSTQTYDIPQYSGKRNRSLSCEDYSDWNPAKKTNSILSSSSGKQSSFQQDSSQSSEYIHSLLQTHVKHGAEIVKLLKEAELHHFELEDVTAALAQCGDENPIKWLLENWNKMIDTVVTLATNYGREQVENTIGTISSIEAQTALRQHNGDIWAAVTECIRQRQTKYTKLMSRGLYSREDVVTVLTANHGNLEAAYKELSKSQLKPFLMKIWGPPQGLDNDSGDISELHYKDHEYDSENGAVELPSDKQNFNRIQSWLDTSATSSTDFDELLQFEDISTNLRKQSNSNINKFSSRLWEQRQQNLGALQNEKLSRYSSCDNLKNSFDNILYRKKCYASTDVLSVPRTESTNDPLQLNPFRIKNREKYDCSDFQDSNELEQHISRRSHSKKYNSTQNVEISESEVENPLQNYIKNYLNNACTRQDTQYPYSVLSEDTQDYIDLNDGLIEIKKIVPETNKRLGSTDQTQNKADHPATTTEPIQKNKLFSIKPDFIRQNSQTSASQNNLNPFEVKIGQKFDIQEKSVPLIKVLIPAKNINFENNIQNGLYPENAFNKFEESFRHRSQGAETKNNLETLIKKYQEKENNGFIVEGNDISKTEEARSKYFEENKIFENVDESKNSKNKLSHQKNKNVTEEFCIRQQNLRPVVKVETSLLAEGSENLDIPNVISEQSNKNSSRSFPSNSKLKAVPLSCGPGNQTEEILQAELNALYWLAKCHLDFHIIETKDAPLHSAIIPKTCINDYLEITGSKIVLEFDEIKSQNSSSKDRNEYEENNRGSTPAMKNDIREVESPSKQTGIDIATSISEKNTDFLVDREESKVSKSQNEVINNTKSPIIEIISDESMRLVSEKEQVETSENQHKNCSNLRKKTSNKEKEFILGDKNIENPINQITHTIADTIIQNKEDDIFLSNGESQSTSNQNEPYTTEINPGNEPSESILSLKGNSERLSNKNEIDDNAKNLNSVSQFDRSYHPVEKKTAISKQADNDGDATSQIEMNREGYQFNTKKAKITRRNKISTASNLILDEDLLTENDEENENKNEEFEVPSMKSGNEINDNKVETDNHPISIENDNIKSDNFLSEIENKHEVPQISNQYPFLLKSNNPVIKGTSESTDFVKNENSCDVLEEIKFGQEISNNSPNNKKLTETQNRLARKISSSRLALIENLETEENEHSPNEVQENDEINKLYQSKRDTVAAKGCENSTIVLENGSTDETDALTEPNGQISLRVPNNTTGKYSEIINQENSENHNVDSYTSSLEAEARHFLTEGVVSTIDQAELVAQLLQLKFDRSQSIDAAIECSSIYSAIVYLQQECHLCTEKFSMKQMISLLECEHKCCQECARQFFSLQINEKSIEHCVCPFCEEPKLSQLDSDAILNYFSNLDILLKTILEPEIHELFQQKLRDRTLMQDPSFKWCSKCSFGFIADLDQKRLSCPSCKATSCANCGKLWTMEHHGKSCEQYNEWLATQNDSNTQFENYLEENGITCPKCDTKFILVKGGCMHLTCTHCKYEFCSDCLKPFSMGADCKHSDYCIKLGLHAHHPRNCLFYLRDKEPGELKQLLLEHNIELNLQNSTEKRCSVQLQRETEDGLIDMKCSAQVEEGGLCRCHLREYLSRIICQNKLETINLLTLDDLETVVLREGKKRPPRCYGMPQDDYYNALYQVLRRQGKSLPIRSANSFEHEYRKHCIEIVKEEIPLA